jgi:hypothetical protein
VARPKNHNGWKSTFSLFVAAYGAEELAAALDVVPQAVHHWVTGETIPRPLRVQKIVALATERGLALTLEEIYRHAPIGRTLTLFEKLDLAGKIGWCSK